MNLKERRRLRGKVICRVPSKKIIGTDKGKIIMKSIRENVLRDIQKLLDAGKTASDIHEALWEKYHFSKNNNFETRYIEYLRK